MIAVIDTIGIDIAKRDQKEALDAEVIEDKTIIDTIVLDKAERE